MAFSVGQKVEYIGGKNIQANGLPVPKARVPYTVSNVYDYFGVTVIELIELPFAGVDSRFMPGFNAGAFRPIVERKTDISFAHEILRKASKPAKTPAVVTSAYHRQQGE